MVGISFQVRFMNSRLEGNGINSEAAALNLISQIKFSGEWMIASSSSAARSLEFLFTWSPVLYESMIGLTPLGTAMDQKIIQPLLMGPAQQNRLEKPILIIAVSSWVSLFPRLSFSLLTRPSMHVYSFLDHWWNSRWWRSYKGVWRYYASQPGLAKDPSEFSEPIYRRFCSIVTNIWLPSVLQYGPGALSLQIAQIGNDQKAQAFLGELDNHPVVGGLIDCTSNFEAEQEEMMRKSQIDLDPSTWIVKMLMWVYAGVWCGLHFGFIFLDWHPANLPLSQLLGVPLIRLMTPKVSLCFTCFCARQSLLIVKFTNWPFSFDILDE